MNKRLIKSNDGGVAVPASFNTVTYRGNASTLPITDVGFEPDFVWIKQRSYADNHNLWDRVRGLNNYLIANNLSAALSKTNGVTSLDIDGFTLGSWDTANTLNQDYVAWCWKAGGAAVLDTSGDLDAYISANVEAGFSIIKHSPQTAAGQSLPHGLSKPPKITIHKSIDNASAWGVFAPSILGDQYLYLYTDTIGATSSDYTFTTDDNFFYTPTSGYYFGSLFSGDNLIYAFHEVEGFSKFGSYVGNGVARTIALDFTPAFVMIKRTGTTGSWQIFDNKRSTYRLIPNSSSQEQQSAGTNDEVTLVANGFTLPTDLGNGNNSALAGNTYIYMAFANQF